MVIRNLRIERGWSQEELAEISGVSTRTIQRIERGGKASLESLKCLAAVFETSISDLRKDDKMTNPNDVLTDEDRAALKYAHNLKVYDEKHKKRATDCDPVISEQEREVRKHVKRMKEFYGHLAVYLAVILFLLVINLLTSPGYLWVVWVALGWGIAVAIDALSVFGLKSSFAEEWERRQIEKRLRNL